MLASSLGRPTPSTSKQEQSGWIFSIGDLVEIRKLWKSQVDFFYSNPVAKQGALLALILWLVSRQPIGTQYSGDDSFGSEVRAICLQRESHLSMPYANSSDMDGPY